MFPFYESNPKIKYLILIAIFILLAMIGGYKTILPMILLVGFFYIVLNHKKYKWLVEKIEWLF